MNDFRGKRITVMGLGLLGRGIGDVRFLASQGAILTVTDLKTKEALAPALAELKKLKDITYVLGEHRLEDFRDKDMIIKSAGVPLDSPYIEEARKEGIPIEMSTSLFARITPATIIGITGTRGKSTVTHLLYEILKEAYKGKKQKVYLGGNVKGVSTLELLPVAKKGDMVVLELDSWQLQGFGEAKISPHVSIFTTFMSDHLNYYKNDTKQYFTDKSYIYRFQKKGDILVAGKQMASLIRNRPDKIIVDENTLPVDWKLKMPGIHNRYNTALAVTAALALGVKKEVIKSVAEKFKGVPGRLELVRTVSGVSFYNDTTATTPEATIAALEALGIDHAKHIVLIMGGADKALDMSELPAVIKKYVKAVVLLPGTGTDRIISEKVFQRLDPVCVESLPDALHSARIYAAPDDIVLFSPAFASFGLFKNEFDRGEQFNTLCKSI